LNATPQSPAPLNASLHHKAWVEHAALAPEASHEIWRLLPESARGFLRAGLSIRLEHFIDVAEAGCLARPQGGAYGACFVRLPNSGAPFLERACR
jgi:hypothetical protein